VGFAALIHGSVAALPPVSNAIVIGMNAFGPSSS
jgi:hypothetical protein